MYLNAAKELVFSPSDLITYMSSPFASWMDHYHLDNPGRLAPDVNTDEKKIVVAKGYEHEARILQELRDGLPDIVEIPGGDREHASQLTRKAFDTGAPALYQGFLTSEPFAGWSDFIVRCEDGRYQVWDTKLARNPKPYFAVQLCCYTEMLWELIGKDKVSDSFGVILGSGQRVEYRMADHYDYFVEMKTSFLAMHQRFVSDFAQRPEPLPRADHKRWTSYAEAYFTEVDHLVQVAGITAGSIKKLYAAGITTVEQLSQAANVPVAKMSAETLNKLVHQASLQVATRNARVVDPHAKPTYELIGTVPTPGQAKGLSRLPVPDPKDVYFDLEGYPLVAGGLEYLWGVCYHEGDDKLRFRDWWAHDSAQERLAFEGFIDWVYERWKASPGMHIFHYASYELSVVRRLSTRYSTRQDEVDDLLRNEVFVDLYKVVLQSIRLGEDSYSIKRLERLYREAVKRKTEVATAGESIVQYARWLDEESATLRTWQDSPILKGIRDYNEDDCISTYELVMWLRNLAASANIGLYSKPVVQDDESEAGLVSPFRQQVEIRQTVEDALRGRNDGLSTTLADVIDFHRREQKPLWWAFFDRQSASIEDLWYDHTCIADVQTTGAAVADGRSFIQEYRFNPLQECKLNADGKRKVMFAHEPSIKMTLHSLDTVNGVFTVRLGKTTMAKFTGGTFPAGGSVIPDEIIDAKTIQMALTQVCASALDDGLPDVVRAILTRKPPVGLPQRKNESTVQAAQRIVGKMNGDCLIIQGPPGTGKTYTASKVIEGLLRQGKRVGITSNSHKAILNLMSATGSLLPLQGVKVGGDDDPLFMQQPGLTHVDDSGKAIAAYEGGLIGGTAWLFSRDEWVDQLDYLFVDEAGQVSLANALAVARCARNVVLMGDQMQLEQPIKGAHPGDSALSVLQYYLKDEQKSIPDHLVLHAVVPPSQGLFLGESRRMHPDICSVVSDMVYEGRLGSHSMCAQQRIILDPGLTEHIKKEHGIIFSPVIHDGNVQSSEEEIDRIIEISKELLGCRYIDKDGRERHITLDDILFISPYNAQVRALRDALPEGANVGSVDKFQGQEAPICILSVCSSYSEYGSRGLSFILDTNRINVAISRAKCLAIVVGDPRICSAPVSSIEEMRLVNGLCRLMHEGGAVGLATELSVRKGLARVSTDR